MRRPEQALQIAIVNGLRLTLDPVCRIFHPPNGGYRTPVEAAKFRAMGLLAGLPDLGVMWPAGRTGWLEIKADGGRLTDLQRACHEDLRALGFSVETVRSIDEALAAVARWGCPIRGRIAA
jgi:hypothetical protein